MERSDGSQSKQCLAKGAYENSGYRISPNGYKVNITPRPEQVTKLLKGLNKKMTKEEFFKMRDETRSKQQEYQPKNYQNDLLEEEEQRAIAALNGQKSGVFKTADIGFTGILCVETYIGKAVKVCRRKIDELDNVTIWRY